VIDPRIPAFVTPVILVLLALHVSSVAAFARGSEHLETSIISDVASIAPGAPFMVAVAFEMEEEWHIYWRNPGDAGLATSIEWNVPEGFTVEPLEWPVPRLFGDPPEVSYGYAGKVVLAARVTPPAGLAPGGSVEIAATARWLVCKEACIPGNSTMSIRLPVESSARANSATRPLIDNALAATPRPNTRWKITAVATSSGYTISVPSTPAHEGESLPMLRFLPYEESVIDHSAMQATEKVAGATLIHLAASPFAAARTERLKGTLVEFEGSHPARVAMPIEIDLPVERE
jgi:DsbC/DsbD-like thiol-disulfide interchange protein